MTSLRGYKSDISEEFRLYLFDKLSYIISLQEKENKPENTSENSISTTDAPFKGFGFGISTGYMYAAYGASGIFYNILVVLQKCRKQQ